MLENEKFGNNIRVNGGLAVATVPTSHARLPVPADHKTLTQREMQVLRLISDGFSTKEIAVRLGISFKTSACHRSRILAKFDVHNSVTLVRYAIRSGLIQP